jgi:hypothetical protein
MGMAGITFSRWDGVAYEDFFGISIHLFYIRVISHETPVA